MATTGTGRDDHRSGRAGGRALAIGLAIVLGVAYSFAALNRARSAPPDEHACVEGNRP